MTPKDDFRRYVVALEKRVAALERELRGLRSRRQARSTHKRNRFQAVVSEPGGISPGGSGEVTIYKNGEPTTWKPTAWNVWMHGDQAAAYDTEVVVEWWRDKGRFELASQGCDAGGDHVALPEE